MTVDWLTFCRQPERYSLIADLTFNGVNACVKAYSVLLDYHLLLDDSVNLLLEELALVSIVDLELIEILVKIGDVLDNFFQDIVSSLCSMVLQGGALAP